jgi:putative endonuclease
MFKVYIIQSIKFGKLYTGFTDDLESRLKKHNSGNVRSTKAYKPYKIIYTEDYVDKTSARKRELFLKSGQGRKWIKERIDCWRDGPSRGGQASG